MLMRRATTQLVDVVFYIMEANVVVAAGETVKVLNQMTLAGLTQRFGEKVR